MKSILFVCKANRIRSPLAEHLMRRRLGDAAWQWLLASAGTWTAQGLLALPLAVEAGAALGVDLSAHRSRRVEDVGIGSFDLILTMERNQRDALRAEFPALADRIFTLGEMATAYAFDIADPVGQAPDAYLATAREIDSLLEKAWARMEEH